MKRFKYNVVKLIEAIKDRPCLWNKNVENYKDRVERKLAWIEIFNILDERYDEMSSDDKRLTSEIVLSKWTNIRDTFVKTLRKKGRKGKHYILYEHLTFLLAVLPDVNLDHDNFGYDDQPSTDDTQKEALFDDSRKSEFERFDDSDASSTDLSPVFRATSSKRKRPKKESHQEEERNESNESLKVEDPNIDFVSIDESRIMNEDEAFFASLLPSVVKYSEEERLEFRIEVLALMKRISDKRKWSSNVNG